MIELPPTLLAEVDHLVQMGMFSTREAAVAELVRLGLDTLHHRARRTPGPLPPPPPAPPGVDDPGDDTPISVDPRDPKWL